MGIQLRKARLAVVFSRADLLERPVMMWRHGRPRNSDWATWSSSACLSFGEVRFFHTAAVIENEAMDESIPALVYWVLTPNGMDGRGNNHD